MKKEKIKVYLQYPWKFPDSPYYKYLIDSPPEEVEYLNVRKQKGVITNKKFFWFSNFLKREIRKAVRILAPSLPNAHKSPKGDYDLIHCAHCLSKNKDKPWVADIEYTGQLWEMGTRKGKKNKRNVEEILLSKNCKKIVTWTNLMKEQLILDFPKIKKKVEVVYPGIPILENKKKKHQEIVLSYVARYFYKKGGLHALEVMNRLSKEYNNVKGIIVGEVPEEVKKRYSKNKKIKFYPLMPQKKVIDEVYSLTDVFIYPGYSDSFGFAIPEVMGIGIPVISVDVSSRKEIINNNKNGFVIETHLDQLSLLKISSTLKNKESIRLIEEMEKKVKYLIDNPKVLSNFSKDAKKEIKSGKFSIERQKKEMGKIYREALK